MTETTSAPAKPKGADNNKRLGALEAGVSALALALAANGISLEDGTDPLEAAIGAIKTVAELREQVEGLTGQVEELNKSIAVLEEAATAPPAAAPGTSEQEQALEAAQSDLHQLAGYASATLGRIVPDLDLAPLTDERPFAYLERLTLAANPRIDELLAGNGSAEELATLRSRVTVLETENAELQVDVEELANAKNTLANQLAAEGKGTAPAPAPDPIEAEPEPEPIVRAEGARDVPASLPSLSHVALGALVHDGGPFEIVFSNGEFEHVEFGTPPITIAASDLIRVDSSRYLVGKAINIRGGLAPAKLAGVGLFYAGEQVAFCAFEPAAVIQPGQERRFDRSLIFG